MIDISLEEQRMELINKILAWTKDMCERICGHLEGEDKEECIRKCRESLKTLKELIGIKNIE